MGIKVCKFGGSSLADAAHFQRVRDILLSDPQRRFVVASAPGKRDKADEKVTDLLYQCYRAVERKQPAEEIFARVAGRYMDIANALGLENGMQKVLEDTFAEIVRQKSPDFTASRGEYLNAFLLARYLGWDFIDAADVVRFDKQGAFAAEWTNRITGSLVAAAVKADIYENWTDVSGFLMADPRIVENPQPIDVLTYRELRELSYMGATVLHEDAIFPVHRAGIPTAIKNTNAPEEPGTLIVAEPVEACFRRPITGIAGHKDFTLISIEKAMMNSELGFGRRVLQALEDFGVSFEHLPTGIDTMCVVIPDRELTSTRAQIVSRIRETCQPDSIEVSNGLALIATVGHGMVRTRGTAARLFNALSEANVNVRMIDQGSSELNIIVGVDVADFETAVRAIYHAFVK